MSAWLTLGITPGRSGSTFIADALKQSYGDRAFISHERLTPARTLPRVFFHAYDEPRRSALAAHPPVAAFMDEVERQLEHGPVVAIGMCMSHLAPALLSRFGTRVRCFGLFRHPISTAASFTSRGRYHNWPHWNLARTSSLTPFDPGMQATTFQARWPSMSPFEKNLYFWLEVALLWQEVQQRYPEMPALHVASEKLFKDPVGQCQAVADFAGLNGTVQTYNAPTNSFNVKGTRRFPLGDSWLGYARHPEVLHTAAAMGYKLERNEVAARLREFHAPDTVAYKMLYYSGWYHVRTYIGRRLQLRHWRRYWQWREVRRAFPQYRNLL